MTDNVGLSTPRGSGTSGYVQRNLSHLKPRATPYSRPGDHTTAPRDDLLYRQRQPDPEILLHERKRKIEVKVFEERERLEEEGKMEEEEIDEVCDALKVRLTKEMGEEGGKEGKGGWKRHQVHEMAEAKIKESERLRRALGIREDYQEGGHWKRQEEREREREGRRGKGDGGE